MPQTTTDKHEYIDTLLEAVKEVHMNFNIPFSNVSCRCLSGSVRFFLACDCSAPPSQLTLAGHSLGGGLSALVGLHLGIPAVSFSGPGVVLTGGRLFRDDAVSSPLVFVPDFDIVPRIDLHQGTVQVCNCAEGAMILSSANLCNAAMVALLSASLPEHSLPFVRCLRVSFHRADMLRAHPLMRGALWADPFRLPVDKCRRFQEELVTSWKTLPC